MRIRSLRIALVIGALFVAAACDEPNRSPTAPTPTAPGPTTPLATSLTISGSTSIPAPGGTTQLTATARYSDDTTRDVTAEAQWRSLDNDVVSVISPGLIRGGRHGKGGVRATYGSAPGLVSASVDVRVAPDGAFVLTVVVSDGQWAAEGVRVQVNSPAGTYFVETDLWGVVWLPAVGDAMLQVEKAGFRTIRRPVTVSNDQVIHVVLERSNGASSTSAR